MTDKRLCVCIPTYNRKEAVERVLKEELLMFQKYDIDIIIFDSSTDGRTKRFVQEHGNDSTNLFYQGVDSEIPSNIKVYMIFQQMGKSEYEYIWLIHDHTICNETAIIHLLKTLELNYDFYVLNMQSDHYSVEKFLDISEFLYESAWRLNSFGAAVIRRDTFLENVNWDSMSRE